MQFPVHALAGLAVNIPITPPTAVSSISPIILRTPDRPVDLQLRVSFPASTNGSPAGCNASLPILLLAYGNGNSNWLSSFDGYVPMTEFFAGHGFAVILPTQLNSPFTGLNRTPEVSLFFDQRPRDFSRILNRLDEVEAAAGLHGRLDRQRIVVVGHSAGGNIAAMLLGQTNTDPWTNESLHGNGRRDLVSETNRALDLTDQRIRAGVIIGGLGNGSADLSENMMNLLPACGPDFSEMRTPALVAYGDRDVSPHLTVRGADWHGDAYYLSPAPKDLLVVKNGHHGLGGLSGWDALETQDESPQMVEAVLRLVWAYLRSELYEGDNAWEQARAALELLEDIGHVERKRD